MWIQESTFIFILTYILYCANFDEPHIFPQRNFVESMAGYSILCYLLQVQSFPIPSIVYDVVLPIYFRPLNVLSPFFSYAPFFLKAHAHLMVHFLRNSCCILLILHGGVSSILVLLTCFTRMPVGTIKMCTNWLFLFYGKFFYNIHQCLVSKDVGDNEISVRIVWTILMCCLLHMVTLIHWNWREGKEEREQENDVSGRC